MSVHKKPDGRCYVSFRDEKGKQHTKTFGRGRQALKEAQSFDLKLESERKLGIRPSTQGGLEVYFDQLAQLYTDDRRAAGSSNSYIYDLKNLINNHLGPLLNIKPVDELTYEDMMQIAGYYKERSQSTRNRYFVYLRAIFRFGVRHGITKNNPLQNWSKKKEAPRKSMLTIEDLRRIISHAGPHLKWALEVQWHLGTRPGPSELLALKWENVDFGKGIVSVFATKTGDWRQIPISSEFLESLRSRREQAKSDFIVEYNGRPMKKFRRSFDTACRRAGITYACRMYDVRHLFATMLLSGGADLAAVSKLLGHSTTYETANTYYELLKGEKERAVSLLPSIKEVERADAEMATEGAKKVVPLRSRSKMLSKNVIQ
ncbi:MAG: site-specific integrase [Syntrophobacter sp.]